jgi:YVTN family beta-propeller protein
VSTLSAGHLYRIDGATLAKTDSFVINGGMQRLAIAPSGDSVYVANESHDRIHIVRPSTRTVSYVTLPYSPHGVALSADGSKLYVAQVFGGRVTVLDRSTLQILGAVWVGGSPRNLVALPGTSRMLVSTQIDLVRVN